jgi:hypothetical protein
LFVAPFGIELSAVGLHDAGAIEPAVAAFAGGANGGLVVTAAVPFGGRLRRSDPPGRETG